MASAAAEWPDPQATDPRRLGWMKGSPPAADKTIRFDDGSYLRFPMSRWSFSHAREFTPTATIWRGDGPLNALPHAPRPLDDITLRTLHGETMTWRQSLMRTYFDGVVVLHRGAIVYEDYFGEGCTHVPHMLFSITKSLVGTIAAMLVHDGELDQASPVTGIAARAARHRRTATPTCAR